VLGRVTAWTARFGVFGVVLAAYALSVGCMAPNRVFLAEVEPFSKALYTAEGHELALAGQSLGHSAGERSTITVALANHQAGPWDASYCVVLLSAGGVVAVLAQAQVALAAGEAWTRKLDVTIPKGLLDGAYGLTLVIPPDAVSPATVWVGQDPVEPAGVWPRLDACPV